MTMDLLLLAQEFGRSHPMTWPEAVASMTCPICFLVALLAFFYFISK